MAIRAILGFEHLEAVASWSDYMDNGFSFSKATSGTIARITNGWITGQSADAVYEWLKIPLGQYCGGPGNEVALGWRTRLDAYVAGSYIADTLTVRLFNMTDLPNPVSGATYYIEITMNLTTGAIRRWVNGVELSQIHTLNASQLATAKAGNLEIQVYTKGGTAGKQSIRDIYVTDDQGAASGFPVGRLGAKVVAPINFDSVTSPDWTPNSGSSLLAALNNASGEVPTTNYVQSAASKGDLTANLNTPGLAAGKIWGIQMTMAGKSLEAGSVLVGAKLKNGSAQVTAPNQSFTVAGGNLNLGIFHKAPDGTDWDITKLNATDLVVTPDITG